jgi:methylsterol monooxygenase
MATIHSPARPIIYCGVTDIPGSPQRRHTTIGEAFCSTILGRDYHDEPVSWATTIFIIPADFDSMEPVERWFILDLGVTG